MTITELNNEINNIRENYNKIEFKLQSILLASTTLSIEKYKNEEVVMAEWCSGKYVEQWEKVFIDGEVILDSNY